jgi:hypothetical protein
MISINPGTGRAGGIQRLVVMPCRSGGTPKNSEVIHGKLTEGVIVRAEKVDNPDATNLSIVGVSACRNPSGRIPSTRINKAFLCFFIMLLQ